MALLVATQKNAQETRIYLLLGLPPELIAASLSALRFLSSALTFDDDLKSGRAKAPKADEVDEEYLRVLGLSQPESNSGALQRGHVRPPSLESRSDFAYRRHDPHTW